ncbi:hypothetical protein, partial [Cupriavidus sp. IDO]|uniref:hypothetical protein n=1 Tax=Cupriavidus sp. IDO TaxID=1539142 RepID=UPI001EE6BE33
EVDGDFFGITCLRFVCQLCGVGFVGGHCVIKRWQAMEGAVKSSIDHPLASQLPSLWMVN